VTDTSAPVFIIGGSRTGSEMLKTMLSASAELDFVDELFLYCPRWLHKDLASNISQHVGSLSEPGARDALIKLLYSGIPYGWFWANASNQLSRDMLEHELADSDLDMRELFRAIMVVHASMHGKMGTGAKFPLHFSSAGRLLEWFPNCRIIQATRNPKAVYASQSAKYLTNDQSTVSKSLSRFQQFVHINIQTTWTARIHERLAGNENYRLVRYEDMVLSPREQLVKLCEFLAVDFDENMLRPKQYGSSFNEIAGGQGVSRSSLERWRTSTSSMSQCLMDLLHGRAYRILGYDERCL